jgi:two-component sensor histidine kinase
MAWIFLLFPILTAPAQESQGILSIKQALREAETVDQRLSALNDLSWEYHTNNFDSADHYVDRALTLARENDEPYWIAVSMEMKAILLEVSGRLDEAIKLYLDVIPIRQELGGDGLENTYNNMAIIFRTQENYAKALEYFRRSHEIEMEKANTNGIAASLVNLAIIYDKLGRNDTVPSLLKRSLELSQDPRISLHSSINLGNWYANNGKNDSAMAFYRMALPMAEESEDLASACVSRIGIAEIMMEESRLEEAEEEFSKALKNAKQINYALYDVRIHRGLSTLYRLEGKYTQALDELEKYLLAREEVLNEEKLRLSNELEQKYESERKEREIAQLELASIAQNLEAEKTRNQRTLLFLLAALLLVILGFVSYRFINQRKVAAILRKKNQSIAEALDERELLLREIHHRVKNNLQVVSSILSIQGRNISDESAREAISESKNRVRAMAMIHQFLYSDHQLAGIDMYEYIPNLCRKLFDAYKLDHDLIELKVNVEPISLDIDTAIPLGLIINELITNSLKYAFEPGRSGYIEVKFFEKGANLVLIVKDNGRGYAENNGSELSFGMKLISAFKEKLKASIDVSGKTGYEVICTIGNYKRLWQKDTEYSSLKTSP